MERGIARAVSGILESATGDKYINAVANAMADVGSTIYSRKVKDNLCEALKLNITNRREYPFELLQRKYGLPISLSMFKREKYKLMMRIAKELELEKKL